MAKPLNGSDFSPESSPTPDTTPGERTPKASRKRVARYLGVWCERSGPEYRLRWVDAETGRRTSERLPPSLSAKERELRRKDKAAELGKQRTDLVQRADRVKHGALTVAEALGHYFKTKRLTPGTRRVYAPVSESFRAWCASSGVRYVRDLQRRHLRVWRAERLAANKLLPKPGGKRGEHLQVGARSTASANKELRALSAILNHLRDDEVLRLSSDDIRTGLAREKHDHDLREFLSAIQVRALLDRAADHDAKTFRLTRSGSKQSTPKYKPIAPFLRAALLTGMRLQELLGLLWEHVPEPGDRIRLPSDVAKGGRARVIDLGVSPSALPERPADATGSVFGLTEGEVVSARKRLLLMGAPAFTFHGLRRTCGTFLTCAPGIYGGASAYMSARRLGHSVQVAERHYVGQVTVAPEARTLEAALGLLGWREAALQREQQRGLAASVDLARDAVQEAEADLAALLRRVKPPE